MFHCAVTSLGKAVAVLECNERWRVLTFRGNVCPRNEVLVASGGLECFTLGQRGGNGSSRSGRGGIRLFTGSGGLTLGIETGLVRAEGAQLPVERGPGEPQLGGRLHLVAGALGESGQDGVALQLLHGRAAPGTIVPTRRGPQACPCLSIRLHSTRVCCRSSVSRWETTSVPFVSAKRDRTEVKNWALPTAARAASKTDNRPPRGLVSCRA